MCCFLQPLNCFDGFLQISVVLFRTPRKALHCIPMCIHRNSLVLPIQKALSKAQNLRNFGFQQLSVTGYALMGCGEGQRDMDNSKNGGKIQRIQRHSDDSDIGGAFQTTTNRMPLGMASKCLFSSTLPVLWPQAQGRPVHHCALL